MNGPAVAVVGAGAAGLVTALALAERGARVSVFERAPALGAGAASWLAGGMLAPFIERECAEESIETRGQLALSWWAARFPDLVTRAGSLVVAPPRDRPELTRFARRTRAHRALDAAAIAALEPALGHRFPAGLFYPDEAHLDPRAALAALCDRLAAHGASLHFGDAADPDALAAGDRFAAVVDARGLAGRDRLADLRGVKGEMVVVRAPGVTLARPVRLLHPRLPLYVVPRPDHRFMIGATMIESEDAGRVTVRSLVELLNAAVTLHPGFGEAEVLETGAGVRPAFPDNLPRVMVDGRVVRVNGLYRHGFLMSPWLGEEAAGVALRGLVPPSPPGDTASRTLQSAFS